ncbi:hypothetical protein UA08_02102 [Talaromyces atroroseus]|uniref:Uncharacterized protein n=1 Tax=Talaromyces atroroseus TaxID=1441469 RepID=A0A1Q5QA63_TALAT|nr:hypothetical protein UA08_02102 [Talaromyces atroroseus]OKL62837.1 hypothetical protein UA08_02102 [Talaromyces atroroseus]
MTPETELHTNMMILDYTCCKATHELLLRRIAELSDRSTAAHKESSDSLLSIFDSCETLMKAKHNTREASSLSRDIQAKLQLNTFTRLFFYRARQSGRNSHHTTPSKTRRSFSATDYAAILDILKIPRIDRLEDRSSVVSLIDLFPDFLSLCSAMSASGALSSSLSSSSSSLGDLLGKYLLQSALEQYTLFNREATEVMEEMLTIIEEEEEEEEGELTAVTAQYLDLLSPPPTSRGRGKKEVVLKAHFNHLAQHFPAFEFECMMTMQLQDFLFKLETPILVKLETGEALTS